MSGDLKAPRKAIPIGTISAILVALAVYSGLAIFLSYTVDNNLLVNDTNILFKIAWIPQLVIAGVLGATLSSALGSILGAPRIMQAVANDRIAPSFLGKGFGPSNEPRNALIFSFLIAQAGILIGELNVIARIVTIFFIITYGFINITYAIESWASSDFRPSFKIPRIVSIIGAIACTILMIKLDILALAVASVILLSLFFYLKNKELTLNSGDTRSSLWRSMVKLGLTSLAKKEINNRNWRPNIILFSGGAQKRPHLVELGISLAGRQGIFTNLELIENTDSQDNEINKDKTPESLSLNPLLDQTAEITLENFSGIKDIVTRKHVCKNIYDGIGVICSVYGFSGFEPNTVLMGWPHNIPEPKNFENLLNSLKKLDYNLAFLNYNKESAFGRHQKIDFWWSGRGNNIHLALHLIRFITSDTIWRRAEIRILAINESSRSSERFYAVISQLLDNYRIKATIKIINNVERAPEKDIIRKESYSTDLTIAEFPDVENGTASEAINYLNEISDKLKTTLFIRSSSAFEQVNIAPAFKINTDDITGEIELKRERSLSQSIEFPQTEIVKSNIFNLAKSLESPLTKFKESTLKAVETEREIFINKFETDFIDVSNKLLNASELSDTTERESFSGR